MINTLTLNPAVDRILCLDRMVKNSTNRILKSDIAVGGKGTHVSMNLSLMGRPNRAFGLAGGEAGRFIVDSLACCGVEPHFVHSGSYETRTNYLLIEEQDHSCTIIAEKGETPPEEDTAGLIEKMKALIRPGDSLVLSGDIGNYPAPFIYDHILGSLQVTDLRIYLDAGGKTLKQGLTHSPYLIKPNLEEFSELSGREIRSVAEIVAAMERLDDYGIQIIAVTLGGSGAVVKMPGGIYRTSPPEVKVVNTIGCGDVFLAGMIFALDRNWAAEKMLKFATAVSAASAESPLSAGFNAGRARELIEFTRVSKIR